MRSLFIFTAGGAAALAILYFRGYEGHSRWWGVVNLIFVAMYLYLARRADRKPKDARDTLWRGWGR